MNAADESLIDEFCDTIWLEDGLARNTIAAYRRDLTLFAQWLSGRGVPLDGAAVADLSAYFGALAAAPLRGNASRVPQGRAPRTGIRASTQARIHSSFKRFYQFVLRSGRIKVDPTLHLDAPKKPQRFPRRSESVV